MQRFDKINMKINICVGGRFHAANLVNALNKHYKDIIIYTSSPKKNWPKQLRSNIFFVPMPFSIIAYFFKLNNPKLLKYIDRIIFDYMLSKIIRRSDVCHIWAGYGYKTISKIKNLYPGTKIILERSCPHINFQELVLKNESKKYKLNFNFDFRSDIKRQLHEYEISNYIITCSEYSKNSFKKYKSLFEKTKVIYLPSNIETPKIIDKYKNKKIIGFIGDFSLRKGIYCLIRAFEKSKSKNLIYLKLPKLNSENKRFIDKLEKRKLLKIKGYYNSISDFYNEIDYLCIPSIDEGFGVVAIEALQHQVQIIIREGVGSAEILQSLDNVIKFKDENDLEKIFDNIYDSNDISKFKKNRIFDYNKYKNKYYNDVYSFYSNLK